MSEKLLKAGLTLEQVVNTIDVMIKSIKAENRREEKRKKAKNRENQVREEEREKAEAWKLEMSEKLLRAGLPKEQIFEITGIDLEEF